MFTKPVSGSSTKIGLGQKRLAKDKHFSFFVQANNSDVKAFEADT